MTTAPLDVESIRTFVHNLLMNAKAARSALAVAEDTGVVTDGYERKQIARAEHYEEIALSSPPS